MFMQLFDLIVIKFGNDNFVCLFFPNEYISLVKFDTQTNTGKY